MANPVSLLQNKTQEQPLAKHAMTCGLRNALCYNGILERAHGKLPIAGSEDSSRPTGTVRWMHACARSDQRRYLVQNALLGYGFCSRANRAPVVFVISHRFCYRANRALVSCVSCVMWHRSQCSSTLRGRQKMLLCFFQFLRTHRRRHAPTHIRTLIHQRHDL